MSSSTADGVNAVESAQAATASLLERLFTSLPAAVLAVDADGRIVAANRAADELWGKPLPVGELAEPHFRLLQIFDVSGTLVPWERCSFAAMLRQPRHMQQSRHEVEFLGGTRRYVLSASSPLPSAAGGGPGSIFVLTDVTELRQLDEQQRRLETQFHAHRTLEAVETMAGRIAHEFNNLLTGMTLNLQLIGLEAPATGEMRDALDHVIKSTQRGRVLVEQMNLFADKLATPVETIALAQLADDAVKCLRTLRPEREFSLTQDPACPAIRGRPCDLREVLLQLGLNGAQAMAGQSGSVRFTVTHGVAPEEVAPHASDLAGKPAVQVTVEDEGRGMTPSEIERAFDPFYTTRDPWHAAGLGLSMVHGIVKRHRGAVLLESTVGAGTTLRIFLPVAP